MFKRLRSSAIGIVLASSVAVSVGKAAGCKGDKQMVPDPQTKSDLEQCKKDKEEKDKLIKALEDSNAELMRKQTGDPTLADLLDYVLQDEGRHVNFGYFALRRSIPTMDPSKREMLEDFTFGACDQLYARDERTGFQSIKSVWTEMGWDGDAIWRDAVINSPTVKAFNSFLFRDNLMPRLERLGLISERIAPRYREIGLA